MRLGPIGVGAGCLWIHRGLSSGLLELELCSYYSESFTSLSSGGIHSSHRDFSQRLLRFNGSTLFRNLSRITAPKDQYCVLGCERHPQIAHQLFLASNRFLNRRNFEYMQYDYKIVQPKVLDTRVVNPVLKISTIFYFTPTTLHALALAGNEIFFRNFHEYNHAHRDSSISQKYVSSMCGSGKLTGALRDVVSSDRESPQSRTLKTKSITSWNNPCLYSANNFGTQPFSRKIGPTSEHVFTGSTIQYNV